MQAKLMATPIPTNHAPFSLEEVADATAGTIRRAGGPVAGVRIDSRAVEPGTLFVATVGDHVDAHRFLPDVAARGAGAVVVQRGTDVPPGPGVVEVEDPLTALGDLAAFHRRRWGRTVVAITGSAGKTSTKELVAAAIRGAGKRVRRTDGNLNNLFGLPMMVFTLEDGHDVAVLEAGTNRPGEVARLGAITRPDVALVTLVAPAHTEGLGSLEDVAREEASMLAALDFDGCAIVNGEEPLLASWLEASPATKLRYGRDARFDVELLGFEVTDALQTVARYRVGETSTAATLGLLGEGAAFAGAAALCVVHALGLSVDRSAAALVQVAPVSGRMSPRTAAGGALVIDDSYNSNVDSALLALRTAAELARSRGGRAFALLGDIRELGERSREDHERVGRGAAELGVEHLVGVGTEMRAATAVARAAGIAAEDAASPEQAAEAVADRLAPGDVVVVKGSRSLAMERAVDALVTADERL
jgi:UDP-N-acetylmuramoyl-tripeptide--D-alanyl-D-alanine ligase